MVTRPLLYKNGLDLRLKPANISIRLSRRFVNLSQNAWEWVVMPCGYLLGVGRIHLHDRDHRVGFICEDAHNGIHLSNSMLMRHTTPCNMRVGRRALLWVRSEEPGSSCSLSTKLMMFT